MQRVLFRSKYFFSVQYLQGSPLVTADLHRAKTAQAKAVMFLTNKFTTDPDQEDAETIMRLYSVRRFLCNSAELELPLLCLQVILPENTQKLLHDDSADTHKDHIICLNKMRMGVIAKTCLFPGMSTFLFNLLHSLTDVSEPVSADDDLDDSLSKEGTPVGAGIGLVSSPSDLAKRLIRRISSDRFDDSECDDDKDDDDDASVSPSRGVSMAEDGNLEKTFHDWKKEYRRGAGWEIYITDICGRFSGYPFINLAAALYEKLGVVLFALRVKELRGRKSQRVILNPADYVIPSKTECKVEGFVIAEDSVSADLSFLKSKFQEQGRRGSQVGGFISNITKTVERGTNFVRRRASSVRRNNRAMLATQGADSKGGGKQGLVNPFKTKYDPSLSAQEKKQRMRDMAMQDNFHMNASHVSIESITITTDLLSEFPDMRNHIIVTGKSLHNLYDFMLPLREKKRGKFRPIVILYPGKIPYHVWSQISVFRGIYYMRGSPVVERDVRRAGVFRASHFVLLAGVKDTEGDDDVQRAQSGHRMNGLEDADAIFSYHIVRRLNDQTKIIVEMVNPHNASYLEQINEEEDGRDGSDFITSPLFASGSLFTASLLDTFVCQV
jgi:hypothetical protein